jgi:PST family polysaccharide transporter
MPNSFNPALAANRQAESPKVERVSTPLPANAEPRRSSYGQVIKSSSLIGASSLINVLLGIVRTKAMALILGPGGVGLLGLYTAVAELARSVAGLGINSSGVRQIAEAVGSGDNKQIARTVTTLRRVALYFGALGALALLVCCKPVSRITFGDEQHANAVALLSLAVLFGNVSAAQSALVQGVRRVADLARISIFGGLYGTVLSIPIVYLFGERGLVPALVCVAGVSILTSWWYARKVVVESVTLRLPELVRESGQLLKMGVVFMASALITMGSAYVVRIMLVRQLGLDAAGFYQAAWILGGLYVGFILNAMGADFFPRLTAVARDNEECSRLVNEQTEVGLLLAGPGILGTLVLAPMVIQIFYSAKFGPAAEVLRWICLGMMLRVISWPMGFILLAKGAANVFFWSELLANALQLALVWVALKSSGLAGAGFGFFGMYLFYWIGIYLIVRRLWSFRWSMANQKLAAVYLPLTAAVFLGGYFLPDIVVLPIGLMVTMCTGYYSLRALCKLVPVGRLPQSLYKLAVLLRLTPEMRGV